MKRVVFLFLLLLPACTEAIIMDPLEEMPLVVSCVLSRDGGWYEEHPEEERDYTPPAQYLDLYYAQRPSESVRRVISDAAVQVTGPGGPYDFVWNGSRYESAFLPKFDREYKLKIKTADGKELSSSMVFPPDVRLRRYRLIEHASMNNFGNTFAGYYYLQRHYDVFTKGCQWENFRKECFMWIRALENGVPVGKICTTHRGVDNFNVRRDVWSDCAVIDLYAEQFNEFMARENSRYEAYDPKQYEGMSGFTSPIYVDPELWTRFSNAWLSSPLHDKFLRIYHQAEYDSGLDKPWDSYVANDFGDNQPAEPRDLFVLGADFNPSVKTHSYVDVDTGEKVEYEVPWYQGDCYEVRFLSEAYDKYLKAMVDAHAIHGDELSPVYSTKTVYSNIEGGLGCFGGEWITTINISTGY